MRPAVKSAATPLWLPIPDHDHDGDNPDGRLLNDDEDDKNAFSIDELAIILDMKVDEIRDILRLTGDDK